MTAAVEHAVDHGSPYRSAHEAFAASAGGPAWLRELRRAAMEHFGTVGFPTTKQEAWRFTSVEKIVTGGFAPVRAGAVPEAKAALERMVFGEPGERVAAVFVNGRFERKLSTLNGLPDGVVVGSLADAAQSRPDVVRKHLGQHATPATTPFAALNAAFLDDGAFVYVPRNVVVDHPLQIVFVNAGTAEPVVTHPRALFVVEQNAQVSLVEQYVGDGKGPYWANVVTEWAIGENAVVDAYRVQRDRTDAFHTAITVSRQARNSVYSVVNFTFGGALTRHNITAILDGEGAECTVNGLSVMGGEQHVDYNTVIDHAKPHCNSWELFNGVFDDRAHGVFNGRIIVRAGAQKTDSKQTANSLLLSEEARSDSQPQLEIYADDVKCTHGATLGPIDERSMFYLQSRGLDPEAARNLLTYGFGAEILNSVSVEPLRAHLDDVIHAQLEDRQRS